METTVDTESPLERPDVRAQDSSRSQSVPRRDSPHGRFLDQTGTRHRRQKPAGKPPRYQAFADALQDAMTKNGLIASEVARRVWGSTQDKRGRLVARNRDRIRLYLQGTSYPEPENLQRLADAVGLTLEQLAIQGKEGNPGPRTGPTGRQRGSVSIVPVAEQPSKFLVSIVDHVLDRRQVTELIALLMTLSDEMTEAPPLGEIVSK